jgi:CheY-like chemotaxis protein
VHVLPAIRALRLEGPSLIVSGIHSRRQRKAAHPTKVIYPPTPGGATLRIEMCASVGPAEVVVWVIDDDWSVRRALRRLILSAGFAVETFASGREFLEAAPYDVRGCLVLDIHLEGMSGFEVKEHLVAGGAPIPIIFITAHDDEATRERARRAGAAAYLPKPFAKRALLDAIRRAIGPEPVGR